MKKISLPSKGYILSLNFDLRDKNMPGVLSLKMVGKWTMVIFIYIWFSLTHDICKTQNSMHILIIATRCWLIWVPLQCALKTSNKQANNPFATVLIQSDSAGYPISDNTLKGTLSPWPLPSFLAYHWGFRPVPSSGPHSSLEWPCRTQCACHSVVDKR